MIGLLVQLGIIVVLWAINRYMVPHDKQTRPAFQQFQFPRADEATVLPLFWGSVRITGPTAILANRYLADPIEKEISGDTVTTGYRYQLAVQMLLGVPGGRSDKPTKPSKLTKISVGERAAWVGQLETDDEVRMVSKRTLLGGDDAGGGVKGVISYLPGSFTQTNNVFLQELLESCHADQDLCYRGQAVVSLYGIRGQSWGNDGLRIAGADLVQLAADNSTCGWLFGETAQLDGYSFDVFAPSTQSIDSTTVGPIGVDANPVCVLFDILTNPWDRVGRSATTIDQPSFLAAAQTLATEGNGFSIVISTAMDSRDAIGLILEQIDAVLYDDISTGKMHLALIREDYDVDDLDTFDPSNVLEVVNYSQGTWSATVNQVRVTYTDRSRKYKDAPAIQQDQANFYATGAKIRSKDVHYPGCTTSALGDKLAARDLRALSLPFAKIRIAVNRDAYLKRPGSVFKFTWPEFNNMTEVVFRVIHYDIGKLGDERVVLDCVQDRFAFRHSVFRSPLPNVSVKENAFPPTDTHHTEAPWWIAHRAELAGRIVDASDGARKLYLAAPRSNAVALHAEVAIEDQDDFAQDIEPQPYPGRAVLSVDYGRELDPYDTSTGMVIESVEGWTPTDASPSDIALYGKNLLMLVDPDLEEEEIVSFETATDNLDGTFTLNNVRRGNMDTAARAWAAGSRVWAIHVETGVAITKVGRVGFDYAQAHVSRFGTSGLGEKHVSSAHPDVDITAANPSLRQGAPYPVADLLGSCESAAIADTPGKAPATLVEGGLDFSWKRRHRLSETIVGGELADEDPEFDITFLPVAYVLGEEGEISAVTSLFTSALDYTFTTADGVMLGAAGYGNLEVGIQSRAPLRAGNPAAPRVVGSWTTPRLPVTAPDWRNLLRNGRFDDDLNGWTVTVATGDPIAETTSSGLGGGGYYVKGSDNGNCQLQQTIKIGGFIPGNLTAVLQFYHRQITDTTDTCKVTIESLDSGGSTIDSVDTGTITPSSTLWTHVSLELDPLDPATDSLRVTIDLTDVGGLDSAQCALTEFILRVGQRTSQLLAHPSFDTFNNLTHVIAGWTNVSNYFLGDNSTTPFYEGGQFVTAGNVAASEIKQEVALPAGWTAGATSVLELGRANFGADLDTGEVVLEALDGGGAVMDSATTGAEVISPSDIWQRRRLTLAIPTDAVTLRVRLIGTRVTGATCDTAFDDLDLRVWKFLDPASVLIFDFDTPASQPVPIDYDYFDRAWPGVTAPSLAFWAGGDLHARRGTEPNLVTSNEDATVPATVDGKFVGGYDATRNGARVAAAFDFPPGCDGGFSVIDPTFASFTSAQSFSVAMPVKIGSEDLLDRVLCGRVGDTGFGWELIVNDAGHAVFRLLGTGATIEVEGARFIADRALRVVGAIYKAETNTAYLLDGELATASEDTSALGEIEDTSAALFSIGAPTGGVANFLEGQVGGCWLWNEALPPDDIKDMITQGGLPDPRFVLDRTDGTLATIVATDDAGVLVCRFGKDQVPYAYKPALEDDGGNGLGIAMQLVSTNKIVEAQQTQLSTDWHTVGTATVETNYAIGVEGFQNSISITGKFNEGRELRNIPAGAGADLLIAFFARADAAHTARVELDNEAGVNKDTTDFAVTTQWAVVWTTFDAWDASTATCRLRFAASNDGTPNQLEICGPFYLSHDTSQLPAIPVTTSIAASGYNTTAFDLGIDPLVRQHTLEGELQVIGVAEVATPFDGACVAEISQGGSSEFRALFSDASGSPSFFHSATDESTSTAAPQSWDSMWSIRGRWNMAGLLDAASVYAGVLWGDENGEPADYDRVAQWTDTGLTLDTLRFGADLGDVMPMVVRRVVVRTRERRLVTESMV